MDAIGSIKKIRNGKFSEEVIKSYMKEMQKLGFSLGELSFLMEYYSNLLYLSKANLNDGMKVLFRQADEIVGSFLEEKKVDADKIKALREGLIKTANFFYSYQSVLIVFRYALLRKCPPGESTLPKNREEEAREILEFIFSSKDNMITNIRISEVLQSLPIRFTRGKFIELVMEALDDYSGSERLAFHHFVDRIRSYTSFRPIETDEAWLKPYIENYYYYLNLNLTNLSVEELQVLRDKILRDVEEVINAIDDCSRLIEIVNALYSMSLLHDERFQADFAEGESKWKALFEAYQNLDKFDSSEEEKLDKLFSGMEMKMEKIYDDFFEMKDGIFLLEEACFEKVMELGLEEKFQYVKEVVLIQDNSFLEMKEIEDGRGRLEKEEVDRVKEELKTEIENTFKMLKLPIRRGIMAKVIEVLPVFLKNRTEVMNYVREALSTCDSEEELRECLWEIQLMRREHDYYQ